MNILTAYLNNYQSNITFKVIQCSSQHLKIHERRCIILQNNFKIYQLPVLLKVTPDLIFDRLMISRYANHNLQVNLLALDSKIARQISCNYPELLEDDCFYLKNESPIMQLIVSDLLHQKLLHKTPLSHSDPTSEKPVYQLNLNHLTNE